MKIREGAYYLMRNRQFIGPVELGAFSERPWVSLGLAWAPDGSHDPENGPHQYDLISEVYVSDTPPADAPAPEVKTLRDEFAGRVLTGMMADHTAPNKPPEFFADLAYKYANAMMEARKK
jgi:hypothetical protein